MSTRQKLDEFQKKSNTAQRTVVAVLAPVCIFVAAYGVMRFAYDNTSSMWNPSNFSSSWVGWFIALLIVGVFEYVWLKD